MIAGCATSEETEEQNDEAGLETMERIDQGLAEPSEEVGLIQLFRGDDERRPPVLPLQSGGAQLTLKFDLLETDGRPLNVRFYHADRDWERRLSPAEFLDGFHHDNLLDYTRSQGTEVPYAHYTYRFPNEDIQFRVSGNYVLRVTEQGNPDDVLFEEPFYVVERSGQMQVDVEGIRRTGQQRQSLLPRAFFTPPSDLRGDPQRYEVCFVRNARFDQVRCQDRPRLARQPELEFDLRRQEAFPPSSADYFVDLSAVQVGGDIERTDRSVSPYQVLLRPDYARFGEGRDLALLNGQVLVDRVVRDVGSPNTQAEYVETRFSFVPPENEPLDGPLALRGNFRGGAHSTHSMEWVEDRERYEGTALIKQGQYEYYYTSTEPGLQTLLRQNIPRARDQFTAFAYYADHSLNTDRLLAVERVEVR